MMTRREIGPPSDPHQLTIYKKEMPCEHNCSDGNHESVLKKPKVDNFAVGCSFLCTERLMRVQYLEVGYLFATNYVEDPVLAGIRIDSERFYLSHLSREQISSTIGTH